MNQYLDDPKVQQGRRLVRANIISPKGVSSMPFVAVGDGKDIFGYGQLNLCFAAKYLGSNLNVCYLRWLHTADAVAAFLRRPVTTDETRGPFPAFRWNPHPGGGRFTGHPAYGSAHYGVVDITQVMYVVPMLPGLAEPLDSTDPLFRLNTDMWDKF